MTSILVPRPIALVSSMDAHGTCNLAPFSYFTGCSTDPPVICFVSGRRPGPTPSPDRSKDTLTNILATGEFVVNIVSEDFKEKMNHTCAEVAPEVDEFALSGLTPLESELVRPPRVAESRAQMECSLRQTVSIPRSSGGANTVIFGDVLRFHVDELVLVEGGDGYEVDPEKLSAIGCMGGSTYARTCDRFDMVRPR